MSLPRKLLVATDFSWFGDRACEVALAWAALADAELHWVHVVEHLPDGVQPSGAPLLTRYIEQARHLGAENLNSWSKRAEKQGVTSHTYVVDAPLAPALVRLGAKLEIDLVVVGTRGHSRLRHPLLGSVAEKVVRDAHCSVLVVRGPTSPLAPGAIVLGDDLSAVATPARDLALELARLLDNPLQVVHSLDVGVPYLSTLEIAVPTQLFDEAYARAKSQLDEAAARSPELQIENIVLSERPSVAICEQAEKAEAKLVVVASHGRRGVERAILGSVAERVVANAGCSVLVAR